MKPEEVAFVALPHLNPLHDSCFSDQMCENASQN